MRSSFAIETRASRETVLRIAAAGGIAVMGLNGFMTDRSAWYAALAKPWFQPPSWVFLPAWALIFTGIVFSLTDSWLNARNRPARARVFTLFTVNAVLNVLWSFFFFRLARPDLALMDVGALFVSIIFMIAGVAPISKRAALLLVPYLAWVGFAAVLNLEIVRLNGPF